MGMFDILILFQFYMLLSPFLNNNEQHLNNKHCTLFCLQINNVTRYET